MVSGSSAVAINFLCVIPVLRRKRAAVAGDMDHVDTDSRWILRAFQVGAPVAVSSCGQIVGFKARASPPTPSVSASWGERHRDQRPRHDRREPGSCRIYHVYLQLRAVEVSGAEKRTGN